MSEASSFPTAASAVLCCFVAYVSASLLFLRFPLWLHRKKQIRIAAKHISHRGGAGERVENTLAAFRHCREVGTEMFELDCRVTRDGQVVVAHDDDLYRISGVEGKISETDFDRLPRIRETQLLTFDSAFTLSRPGDDDDETSFLLLSRLFREFPSFPMNIDPKDAANVAPVLDIVRQFEKEDTVVWGSFAESVNSACFSLAPEIPVLFGFKRLLTILFLFYVGLLPFFPVKESYLEIPMIRTLLHRVDVPDGLRRRSFLIRIFDWLLSSPCLFKHLQRRGLQVYAWVLNYEEDFDEAFRLGFNGVMTDFPTKLRFYLERNRDK